MNKLETYQTYANKCADKLGLKPYPILRWSGDPCKVKTYCHAHCHIRDGEFPRGTICLNKRWFANATVKTWHHTIAHEVAHLAVKSNHNTPTFDRRMVALGVANSREALNARSSRKGHHHVWSYGWESGKGQFKQCRICQKIVYNQS